MNKNDQLNNTNILKPSISQKKEIKLIPKVLLFINRINQILDY